MKVVILAGGLGTRLSEETESRPKPMVEIGGRPILWHIMKIYSHFGFAEFIICLGYKGYMIKEYFANYFLHQADVTINLSNNSIEIHEKKAEPWKVTLVDSGINTMTGGRIKRIQRYVGNETFMATYGDGLSDQDISQLCAMHKKQGKIGTMTTVQPSGRFGSVEVLEDGRIRSFVEKPRGEATWVNAGFFVFESAIFDYISGDEVSLEKQPLERLAAEGQLYAFKHTGFWRPMDTLREKYELESLWSLGKAPWKTWSEE